jgi:hypothetical protein
LRCEPRLLFRSFLNAEIHFGTRSVFEYLRSPMIRMKHVFAVLLAATLALKALACRPDQAE